MSSETDLLRESDYSKSKKFLFERISIAIQRGNSASIRGTFPDFSVVIRRVVNVMPIIFVVVLRMSTALGYEFDECVSTIMVIISEIFVLQNKNVMYLS
jgi:hypothetical protein